MYLYFFAGEKLVDANGKEFFDGTKAEEVQFPATLWSAPCEMVSSEFSIYETTGPYKKEFTAKTADEWEEYQNEKWISG